MIKCKKELKVCLENEKSLYLSKSYKGRLEQILTCDAQLLIYRFIKYLRKTEYHHNQSRFYNKILYIYYRRKKNKLGVKLGIEIWDNTFDEGLMIFHAGNIVVNGMSKIGKNCKLHGNNCIGNNGKTLEAPIIGDNVRLGFGAKVIGGITLADNITVGAGAVVVNSFTEQGITLVGVPAHIVNK